MTAPSDEEKKRIKVLRLVNFQNTLRDSKLLLQLFRYREEIIYPLEESPDREGRSLTDDEAETFLRGALIMCITAIEAYIENSVATKFQDNLSVAKKTEDIEEAFNSAYTSWIDRHKNHTKKDHDAAWAEDSWKRTVLNKFEDDLAAFHNPTTKNIDKLFKYYGGFKNIIEKCAWDGIPLGGAKDKLDEIIQLRGKIVHEGKKLFEDKSIISEDDVAQAINFSENLIKCLERIIFEDVGEIGDGS